MNSSDFSDEKILPENIITDDFIDKLFENEYFCDKLKDYINKNEFVCDLFENKNFCNGLKNYIKKNVITKYIDDSKYLYADYDYDEYIITFEDFSNITPEQFKILVEMNDFSKYKDYFKKCCVNGIFSSKYYEKMCLEQIIIVLNEIIDDDCDKIKNIFEKKSNDCYSVGFWLIKFVLPQISLERILLLGDICFYSTQNPIQKFYSCLCDDVEKKFELFCMKNIMVNGFINSNEFTKCIKKIISEKIDCCKFYDPIYGYERNMREQTFTYIKKMMELYKYPKISLSSMKTKTNKPVFYFEEDNLYFLSLHGYIFKEYVCKKLDKQNYLKTMKILFEDIIDISKDDLEEQVFYEQITKWINE